MVEGGGGGGGGVRSQTQRTTTLIMRFTTNLLLPTTFTLKPRMRQPAGVAEILRSHQKDDIYTGYLKNAVSEVFQEIFGKYLEPQKS